MGHQLLHEYLHLHYTRLLSHEDYDTSKSIDNTENLFKVVL